jgi:hypothetical protein
MPWLAGMDAGRAAYPRKAFPVDQLIGAIGKATRLVRTMLSLGAAFYRGRPKQTCVR